MAHYHKGKRIDRHRRLEILFPQGDFDAWEKVAKERGIPMNRLVRAALKLQDPVTLADAIETTSQAA